MAVAQKELLYKCRPDCDYLYLR